LDSITTVFAPNTSYLDTGADADYHPERYRIAAFDEVNNISPMTDSTLYHNTIYVFPYQDSTNCQTSIRINWNEYINWSEGVSEYKVYMSENYGTWNMLATVPGNISEYYHQNISDNTSYCYYIRAVSNSGRTSTSNQTCFFTNLPDFPHFINADYATVISDERIKISFTLDTAPNIEKNYNLTTKVKSAMMYPLIVMVGLAGVLSFFGGIGALDDGTDVGLAAFILVPAMIILAISPLLVLWWLARPSQRGANSFGPNPHEVHQ